jgi:hypothetical protein
LSQVLDYSAGFPGARNIKQKKYVGAARYGGFPGRRKCTNAAELRDFTANGIGMAIVFEDTETTWRGGYGSGQSGATKTRNHLNDIGFPQNRPIYMAVDQDVVKTGEFDTMLEHLRGAGSVLGGPAHVGVYGEADVIDAARNAGVATYFWQTAAWSRNRRTECTLFQHVGTVYVGGIDCDYNDVLADDWGQHNWEDNMPDPNMAAFVDGWLAQYEYSRGPLGPERNATTAGSKSAAAVVLVEDFMRGIVDAVGADRNVSEWAPLMVQRLAAIQPGVVTDQQITDLATVLGQHLGDDVAESLGRKLLGTV